MCEAFHCNNEPPDKTVYIIKTDTAVREARALFQLSNNDLQSTDKVFLGLLNYRVHHQRVLLLNWMETPNPFKSTAHKILLQFDTYINGVYSVFRSLLPSG